MPQYFLEQFVYVAFCSDGAVFLDLAKESYLGIGARKALAIQPLIVGWPNGTFVLDALQNTEPDDSESIVNDLLARNILTRDARNGKAASTLEQTGCQDVPTKGVDPGRPSWNFSHIVRLSVAVARAAVMFRYRRLQECILSIRNRRQRLWNQCMSANQLQRLIDLVQIYRRIRGIFFSKKRQCLFESLVLIEFLAQFKIYPQLVFGVKTRPFEAHCWVESDGVILNENVDRAEEFRPILNG